MSEDSGGTEGEEIYLRAIEAIVEAFEELLGEETAYSYARKAPLQITPDGEIESFYGERSDALDLLVEQYQELWGDEVALRKVRRALREEFEQEELEMLPDRYVEERNSSGLFDRVVSAVT
jgi:hypothetical protein